MLLSCLGGAKQKQLIPVLNLYPSQNSLFNKELFIQLHQTPFPKPSMFLTQKPGNPNPCDGNTKNGGRIRLSCEKMRRLT